MSNLSPFSGLEMDELFEKAHQINAGQNGWTKLTSTEGTPITIGGITNPGNYSFEYWADGPDALSGYVGSGPISLINYADNGVIRQYVFFFGITYDGWTREYDLIAKTFTEWKFASKNEHVSVGSTVPVDPQKNQVFVDTTDPYAPKFSYYNPDSNSWNEVVPGDMLAKSVYDSEGKAIDFFDFVDEQIAKVDRAESGNIDYDSHMSDDVIHVVSDEVTDWDKRASKSKFNDAIASATEDLKQEVDTETSQFSTETTVMKTTVQKTVTDIETHISDRSRHIRDPYMIAFRRESGDNNKSNPVYVAGGYNGEVYLKVTYENEFKVYTSTDGVNYTEVSSAISGLPPMEDCGLMNLSWAKDTWFLALADGYTYRSTNNGVKWTKTTGLSGMILSVVCLNDAYYACALNDTRILKSDNASSWTEFNVFSSVTNKRTKLVTLGNILAFITESTVYLRGSINSDYTPGVAPMALAVFNNQMYLFTVNGVEVYDTTLQTWSEVHPPYQSKLSQLDDTSELYFTSTVNAIIGIIIDNTHDKVYLTWTSDPTKGWSDYEVNYSEVVEFASYARTLTGGNSVSCLMPAGTAFFDEYSSSEAYLNQKAENDHTHMNDGRVKLDTTYVKGVLPLNTIPEDLKDVNVEVDTYDDLLALTKNEVQNGDLIYEKSWKLLYIVVDDSKLGTDNAFIKYSTGGTAMSWKNFTGIPDTVAGLGITDLPALSVQDNMIAEINNNNATSRDYLNRCMSRYQLPTPEVIRTAVKLKTSIDTVIYRGNTLSEYE